MKTPILLAAATVCLALSASNANAQYNYTAFGPPQPAVQPIRVGGDPSTWGPPIQPQRNWVGGDPSTWSPSPHRTGVDRTTWGVRPNNGPIEIGFGRQETIGRGIGGSRDGVAGQIAGQISAGVDGGISIDPRTGRVRGQIQAGVEGSVLGGVESPAGGVVRQLTRGLSKGISFGL